jgi:hypothetical protein
MNQPEARSYLTRAVRRRPELTNEATCLHRERQGLILARASAEGWPDEAEAYAEADRRLAEIDEAIRKLMNSTYP